MSPLQPAEREAALQLIEWSLREDLAGQVDVTSTVLIAEREWARVDVVVRAAGVLAGGVLLPLVMNRFDPRIEVAVLVADGSPVRPGTRVAELRGPLRSLLTAERTALNFLLHLSGVASLTARYVAEVQGTRARVFDTRKTLPGWRLLDKYAVRAGGGRNHRMGLFDMLLVKDNHVAGWLAADPNHTLAGVVSLCRQKAPGVPLEIEVDTLAQLAEVLPVQPDMVLLDNMSVAQLREGVALRDQLAPGVELEASGGVNLQTIGAIAQTGVERISVGALTHSAPALDLAFDWGGANSRLPTAEGPAPLTYGRDCWAGAVAQAADCPLGVVRNRPDNRSAGCSIGRVLDRGPDLGRRHRSRVGFAPTLSNLRGCGVLTRAERLVGDSRAEARGGGSWKQR